MKRITRLLGVGLIVIGLGLAGITGDCLAAGNSKAQEELIKKVKPITLQLLKAVNEETSLDTLIQLAKERKAQLLAVIEQDPAEVLKVALPAQTLKQLPKEIQAEMEQEVTLEGKLEFLYADDFKGARSKRLYNLKTKDEKLLSLHFADEGPLFLTGAEVRVHGVRIGDKMALKGSDSESIKVIQAAPTEQLTAALTTRKVAVILINFTNNTTQPYTADYARGVTFTNTDSSNAYYKEQSFGKLDLGSKLRVDGDVFGWYTINYNNSTTCDYGNWASAARTAAQADGYSSSNYNSTIYAFPNSPCGWWGLGTVGGSSGSVWINGSYVTFVVSHELGHNLGALHASSYSCTDSTGTRVSISSTCTASEYGDIFDVMGYGATKHMSNYHKGQLNWFDAANTQTVTTDGIYTIAPIEWASTAVQSLRIPRDVSSTGQITKYYYLEARQPFGFDNFSSTDPVVNGVSIRLAPPYTTTQNSLLIDATPATTSFNDAALPVNQTFQDDIKGITVTDKGVSSSGATVEIKFGPATCVPANPSISISPLAQWAYAGQTLPYTLTLVNNNSSSCAQATFNISSLLPAGWSQNPASLSQTLSSGSSANTTINVTSAANAVSAYYTFTDNAVNSLDTKYSASASANYNVSPTDTTPPTVTITSPLDGSILPANGKVKISTTASDASGISKIGISINGTAVKTCYGTTSCQYGWSMRGVSAGTYTIATEATDNAVPTPNTGKASITVTKQ